MVAPEKTPKERVEIDLEEEREFYRTWEASNRLLWEAIQRFKQRTCRELKHTQLRLQRALLERDEAVEQLVICRRMLDKVKEDLGGTFWSKK